MILDELVNLHVIRIEENVIASDLPENGEDLPVPSIWTSLKHQTDGDVSVVFKVCTKIVDQASVNGESA